MLHQYEMSRRKPSDGYDNLFMTCVLPQLMCWPIQASMCVSCYVCTAGNLLKPQLARGELRCIGATTLDEYRKYIEKDPALERRFQQVRSFFASVGNVVIAVVYCTVAAVDCLIA